MSVGLYGRTRSGASPLEPPTALPPASTPPLPTPLSRHDVEGPDFWSSPLVLLLLPELPCLEKKWRLSHWIKAAFFVSPSPPPSAPFCALPFALSI